jgi:hypothetical protein
MYGRWEIADIALIIMLRRNGRLFQRKVALLQTKRLYSREIAVETLEPDDFIIGIGRLGDRTDPEFPMYRQRAFSFDEASQYSAMSAGAIRSGGSKTTWARSLSLSSTRSTIPASFRAGGSIRR